ncbi:MAG: peptidoglycan editing factor PgeF [Chloroherpetonaceae bacterium]|nr:peptidoglycan editing factor PgeF [Chloroherpetonaceae bacterium]MDW8438066.1 peptidoglycan editing factor PgeF [Chloroherpetonaceae bacterium]
MIPLLRPKLFESFPEVCAAQTTREGGVSQGAFRSLNLGLSSGDSIEAVMKNRQILCEAIGIELSQLALSSQVHGDEVLLVEKSGNYEGYDALVTNRRGVFLAVSIADCVPILVYDRAHRAIAAVHAGWRGTAKQILSKTMRKMSEAFGTKGEDCYAFIGACIDAQSYEVDADVADHFSDSFKRYDETRKKFLLDLKAANARQLAQAGVPASQIEISPHCAFRERERFFSFRASGGKTGRMFALIGLK